MLTTHLPLLLVLLFGTVTISVQLHHIRCLSFRFLSERARVDDRLAAINMLPTGKYELDGSRLHKPLHLRLPQSVRERQFYLPAIFHAGNCDVSVRHVGMNHKPSNADLPKPASAMYTTFWPTVRANATTMVNRCLKPMGEEDSALLTTTVMLERYAFRYEIQITDSDPDMPGDGWLADTNTGSYFNIYEPGGSASGHGTRRVWLNYEDPFFVDPFDDLHYGSQSESD